MKIAVVILNWNGRALLEEFLPSVVAHSTNAVIYVADNASTDDSVAFLQAEFPGIKIINNKVNGGFAKGYNDALPQVKEELLILLNSDVEVSPGWLAPLLVEFERDPLTAAVQPKILDYRRRELFEYAGAAGGFIDRLGYPYCRGRVFETIEEDRGQYDDVHEIFWASGACFGIRRDAFFQAGGFDEDFFAHQEEIDLCWRLFNSGQKVKAVGSSQVYHLGGGTLSNIHPRKTFLNFRNSLYALLKNAPGPLVFLLILIRLVLDGIAGIKYLLELKPSHTGAIIRAHFNFYNNFSKTLKKRRRIVQKPKYYHNSSVVLSYFLGGRKTYGSLGKD